MLLGLLISGRNKESWGGKGNEIGVPKRRMTSSDPIGSSQLRNFSFHGLKRGMRGNRRRRSTKLSGVRTATCARRATACARGGRTTCTRGRRRGRRGVSIGGVTGWGGTQADGFAGGGSSMGEETGSS
ncbi:unnamed protein product [Linum trigynum]|uniref:Uncharacterized protein n=1 Tax=Linum trigynum TaxID=586398 RepID=A0AAV2DSD9_9ROSI